MIRIALLLLCVLVCPVAAQPVSPTPEQVQAAIAEIGIEDTPADVLPQRARIAQKIFGGVPMIGGIEELPFTDFAGAPPLIGVPFNATWRRHCIGAVCSNAIYVKPAVRSGSCLFVWHQGHVSGYHNDVHMYGFSTQSIYVDGVRALLTDIAGHGCDLLLFCMPLAGENRDTLALIAGNSYSHDFFAGLLADSDTPGLPMRYFIGPVMTGIDDVLAEHPEYTTVVGGGLSGGAQTMSIVAALEPRLTKTFLVSGVVPLPVQTTGGDYEINHPSFWCPAGALAEKTPGCVTTADLLLLDVAEPNRSALHIHGDCDPAYPAPFVSGWSDVLVRVAAGNGFGSLTFDMEAGRCNHDVSDHGRALIVSAIFGGP